jgi:DNA-binding response OmpR family regulator
LSLKILVVEDEPALREGLSDLLRGAGHAVEAVEDGLAAARRGVEGAHDLVLLDLMLPRLDGLEVCRQLRSARPELPILILTARGAEDETVRGLEAGADDYVVKPFGAKALLARIDALARRRTLASPAPETIEADGCRLDLGRCLARRDGQNLELTPREAGILRVLWLHRTRAVTRAELLERVWGSPGDLETRTVDMAIVKLRQKIERNPGSPAIVVTVKGVGYAWGEAT